MMELQGALLAFVVASHYYDTFEGMELSQWISRVRYMNFVLRRSEHLKARSSLESNSRLLEGGVDDVLNYNNVGLLAPPHTWRGVWNQLSN